MKKITVVTADIINSRRSNEIVDSLAKKLEDFKHDELITPFSMSRGDELQGVINGWLIAPEIIRNLRYHCRPLELRIGIGIGLIEKHRINENSWSMNGPAFHHARMALKETEKNKGITTIIRTEVKELDKFLNCIWLLIDTKQAEWTDKQWEAIQVYDSIGTFEDASTILGISMQNVEKRCRAARWKQIRQAEDTLKQLQFYLEKYHPYKGEN